VTEQSDTGPRTTVDRVEAGRRAQRTLCDARKLPHFAPENGVCWSCYRQIYEELSGDSYITGCPYCHRSYCD
jgi:hypothetical protein